LFSGGNTFVLDMLEVMQSRVEMNHRPIGLSKPAVKFFENRQRAFAVRHRADYVWETLEPLPDGQGARYKGIMPGRVLSAYTVTS
jgi:hypothetical protein